DAPPPGTVAIAIVSVPAHAQVLVGDRVIGETPTQIHLAPGATKPVLVRKAGYVPEHREVTAGQPNSHGDLVLDEIKQFQGVWQLATGELRVFERAGDQVDVYKLQAVSGAREFYRHYAFVPSDRGVAFAIDEEMIDQRAPGDASCHVSAHV